MKDIFDEGGFLDRFFNLGRNKEKPKQKEEDKKEQTPQEEMEKGYKLSLNFNSPQSIETLLNVLEYECKTRPIIDTTGGGAVRDFFLRNGPKLIRFIMRELEEARKKNNVAMTREDMEDIEAIGRAHAYSNGLYLWAIEKILLCDSLEEAKKIAHKVKPKTIKELEEELEKDAKNGREFESSST